MIKKIAINIGLISLIYLFQVTLFQWVSVNHIRPNFILIAVVFVAFLRGDVHGVIYGFSLGLLQDMFFGHSIGFNFILYSLIGYFTGKSHDYYAKENLMMPLVWVGTASLTYNLMLFLLSFLLRGRLQVFYYLFYVILPDLTYTLLIGLLSYRLFVWINQKVIIFEERKGETID